MEIKLFKLFDFSKKAKKEMGEVVEKLDKADEYKTALERIRSCLSKGYDYFSVSDYIEVKDILYEVLDVNISS